MGGGGEAPLAVLLHPLPLVQQVQGQGAGLALAGEQLVPAAQDEGEAGYSLDALVGAGHQKVDAPVGDGDIHPAEGGHGVHDEGPPGIPDHLAHGLDVVEDAAGGLTVDHGHVGNGRVLSQQTGDAGGVGDVVITLGVVDIGNAVPVTDPGHAHPVGPVGADEDLVLVPHHAGEDALHSEGAAALHQDGRVVILRHVPQLEQLAADLLGDGLVVVIPGAPVHQHLLLHRVGGGQGPGGQ